MIESGVAPRNGAIGLKAYLDDLSSLIKQAPATWIRCELHALKIGERFIRMEFIEVDVLGKQVAKVQGGCWPTDWQRIETEFRNAGLALEAGSQVLVKLKGDLNATFGFQVVVADFDLTFALGDLNARMKTIRQNLQERGIWSRNRSLFRPADFVRVSVVAPAGAAGLGDFRSTADRLAALGLAEFIYYEVPFQTRDAPVKLVGALREIYRSCMSIETRSCAVAIIRGGGASADLAWLVDQKLAEAVCQMNVPVMTGIGHERDRTLLDEVACIPCDTPSKVAEHIRSTVIGAALEGQRAFAAIRTNTTQAINNHQTAIGSAQTAADKYAREAVRLAEASVRTAAAVIEPSARTLLAEMYAEVSATRITIGRDARETLRVAEIGARTTASGVPPAARQLLDNTRVATDGAFESARTAARIQRENAAHEVSKVHGSIARAVELTAQLLQIGAERAWKEIVVQLESVPAVASEETARLHRQLLNDAHRSANMAAEKYSALHGQVVLEVERQLDRYQASVTLIRECAEALHPRTVLAAGYTILRDNAGNPLTRVQPVKAAGLIKAEMRDGSVTLRSEVHDCGSETE